MKKVLFFTLIVLSFASFGQTPIITAIMDGTCTGGTPKMIEIYASGTVDFSLYSLENQTNSNTTWGNTTDLSSFGTVTDGFVYVYYDGTYDNFLTEFPGATANMESAVINLNGDDRIRIIETSNSTVIDQYGVSNVDGTGTSWEWLDSYAKRNNETGPDGGFTEANWTIAGANTLDGACGSLESSIGGIGTYSFASNDQTSTVTAPGTQLPAGTISSITTDSVPVFRFDITDAGGDGLPTYVTGIYIVAGPDNTIDFSQSIAGGGINDLTNSVAVPVDGQNVVITTNSVFLPVTLTVPEGGTVSLEGYAFINNTNAPDGGILQFQINAAAHGFIADASGSDFEDPFTGGNITGNDFTIDVQATQYSFIVQPSNVDVGQNITPAIQVAVTDAGGNVDVDYASTYILLSFSGTGNMFGTSGSTTNNGVSTYSDLNFDTPETGVHLTASGSFSDVVSSNFDINAIGGGTTCANAVSIDVGTHQAAHTSTDDYDQWYVYTATTDGRITVENCSSGYGGDTYVEIIENNCSGTNWDSADDVCGTLENLSFNVTAGESYYIGWGDYDTSTPGQYDWTLSFTPSIPIINAYAVSNNELILQYASVLTSVDPVDYTLTATGQTTVNFSNATINATDSTIIHLTASANFAINVILDNINDAANNSTYQFYAGVLPVSYTNTANDPDTVRQGYNLTLTGVVTANDNYNQVWVQDSDNPMSGTLIYSTSAPLMVTVGDTILFAGKKAFSYGITEITSPIIINPIIQGGSATPAIINSSDLEYYKAQDDADAEPWEGQLVTVTGIVIDSLNTSHFEYFGHDCSGNIICFDDDADYHYGSGFALTTGNMYNITGVVTYSYGHYKINPRGTADATEIDLTSLVENPASQVPDAVIDGTLVVDSLNAVEAFKFKVTDEGTDGLPTEIQYFDIYTGPDNTIDLSGNDVDGAWFDFGDANNPIQFVAEPVFNTDHVTFEVDPQTAVIDNGTSREIILHLWFNSAIADGSKLQLMIKADPHGFESTCMNSQFASTFASDVTGGTLTIDTNIGIDVISGKNIKIYPNPSNGIININTENNVNLEVSDITGRIISTKLLTGNTSIQIHNAGIYFLKFSDENGTYVQKVIVQ